MDLLNLDIKNGSCYNKKTNLFGLYLGYLTLSIPVPWLFNAHFICTVTNLILGYFKLLYDNSQGVFLYG
jgi:hypothetical protein